MKGFDRRSDEELLVAVCRDRDAFARFYARYERPVVAFFMRATGSPELAADLTAEVFAAALGSAERFDPELGSGSGWLFGIARHVLGRSRERGRVEDRARRQLGMPVLALDDEAIARVEAAALDRRALRFLSELPVDQRDAFVARVVDERAYSDIAYELQCSESVARKRVSRGLAALRVRMMKEGQ
jgi:RNA polymerase sigma factor (sigma-70 family)